MKHLFSFVFFSFLGYTSIAQTNTLFTIFGSQNYCQGTNGSTIFLDGSQIGVSYEVVFNDTFSVVSGIAGTGDTLYFGQYGNTGSYTIVAHNNITNAKDTMLGSLSVAMVSLPTVYNVSGGGSICQGQIGPSITLSGSQTSVLYDLFLNDTFLVGTYSGSSTSLFLGNFAQDGSFSLRARRTGLLACPVMMNGTAIVIVYPYPEVFNLSGEGLFCSGTEGNSLYLNDSELGVQYFLQATSGNVVANPLGNGDSLFFPPLAISGSYFVVGTRTNVSNCSSNMAGTVSLAPLTQTVYTANGGGIFCEGSTGGVVLLSGSQLGFDYFLDNPLTDPTPEHLQGTGGSLTFDSIQVEGTYTVYSRYNQSPSCELPMNGAVTLSYQSLPIEYPLTGLSYYCEGQQGALVGLSNSELGVSYQLFLNQTLPSGNQVLGTGDSISFGYQLLTGTYNVEASIGGCLKQFSDTLYVESTSCVGVNEIENSPFWIENTLNFKNPQHKVKLFDLSGRLVLIKENSTTICLENIKQGLFVLYADNNLFLKIIRP